MQTMRENPRSHHRPPASERELFSLVQQLDGIADWPRQFQLAIAADAILLTKVPGEVVVGRSTQNSSILYLLRGAVHVRRDSSPPFLLETTALPLAKPIFRKGDPVDIRAVDETQILQIPYDSFMRFLTLSRSGDTAPDAEVAFLDDSHDLDGLERALSFGVLSHLPLANVHTIVSRMEEVALAAGEIVFEQGEAADFFYLVKSGSVEVCKLETDATSHRLAVRGPGDAFGDDALVTGGVRGATVRMLSGGTLLRLSHEDFATLVHQPLRMPVTLQAAHRLVEDGAVWLDLRDETAFAREALPGALNIALETLRMARDELDKSLTYVAYSDHPKTSELGCYLLAEQGLKVYYVAEPIPYFGALRGSPAHGSPSSALTNAADALAEAAGKLDDAAKAILRRALTAERERYNRLLAQRTAEIKAEAEAQLKTALAEKMAELARDRQALLTHARQLQHREQMLAERTDAAKAANL